MLRTIIPTNHDNGLAIAVALRAVQGFPPASKIHCFSSDTIFSTWLLYIMGICRINRKPIDFYPKSMSTFNYFGYLCAIYKQVREYITSIKTCSTHLIFLYDCDFKTVVVYCICQIQARAASTRGEISNNHNRNHNKGAIINVTKAVVRKSILMQITKKIGFSIVLMISGGASLFVREEFSALGK